MSSLKTSPLHRTMKRALLAVLAAGALGSTPAFAVDTVWDPGVNGTLVSGFSSTTGAIGSVTAELQTILSYLMGVSNGGNGLVETISSINDKMAHANANGDQQQAFEDTNARRRTADQIMIQKQLARIPNADGCAETAYSNGRGAAASGTASGKAAMDTKVLTQLTNASNDGNSMATIVKARSAAGYCMQTDVSHNRAGCSAVGTMPGADVQAGSLTQGAVASGQPTNQSLTPAQASAALAAINNMVNPIPPAALPAAAVNTAAGTKYQALMYIATARASAAVDALTNIASIRYANPTLASTTGVNAATGTFGEVWGSAEVKTLYANVFPNQKFPDQPSEWEMLRYDIFSRYADANGASSWQAKSATFTTEEALREIARMEAIQLRLSELQIERQEQGNQILGALLGQQLNPVSAEQVQASFKEATSSSK